jgi:hypothetical protein
VTLTREQIESQQRVVARRRQADAALTPDQEALLKLQSGAGNAAVSRAVLARELPSIIPKLDPPKPMDDAIKQQVVAYVQKMHVAIQDMNLHGTISMPEVVNWVRQNVPASLAATPFQIEQVVVEVLGVDTPPASRKVVSADGRSAEVEARILNSLPKPPKEFKIYAGPGTLTFAFSGSATYKAGPVTATADKDGGSVTVKEGDKSVTGKGSFAGDAFGLKASVKGLSFDAQIKKDSATKEWSHFTANVKIPIAGGETVEGRPPNEEISEAVMKAEGAIEDVIAYMAAGGSPTDEAVTSKMGVIKPALDKVSAAVEQKKGPQASLKITVGTGDPKLGSYGVVSLVINF